MVVLSVLEISPYRWQGRRAGAACPSIHHRTAEPPADVMPNSLQEGESHFLTTEALLTASADQTLSTARRPAGIQHILSKLLVLVF